MTACPYCGGGIAYGDTRFGHRVGTCVACRSVACMDEVTEDDLARFYGDPGYYSGGCAPYGYDGDFARADVQRAPVWEERLDAAARHSRGRRLLEVGPGTGGFLRFARARGWEVLGLDPYPDKGLEEPVVADVAAAALGPFDVICLFDVLEHLREPQPALTGLAGVLAPGGCVVIGLPSAGGTSFRRHRFRWVEVRPPEHLSLPTAQGMRALLSRSGLVAVEVLGHFRHTWQAEPVRGRLLGLTGHAAPLAGGTRLAPWAAGRDLGEIRLRLPPPPVEEQDYVTWLAGRGRDAAGDELPGGADGAADGAPPP